MADDSIMSLLSTGMGVTAGGGVTAVMVRALFTSFKERLDSLEKTMRDGQAKAEEREARALQKLSEAEDKADGRHEKLIERVGQVEASTEAAHRRLDELTNKRQRR